MSKQHLISLESPRYQALISFSLRSIILLPPRSLRNSIYVVLPAKMPAISSGPPVLLAAQKPPWLSPPSHPSLLFSHVPRLIPTTAVYPVCLPNPASTPWDSYRTRLSSSLTRPPDITWNMSSPLRCTHCRSPWEIDIRDLALLPQLLGAISSFATPHMLVVVVRR